MSAVTVGVVSLLVAVPVGATPIAGPDVVVAAAGSDTTEAVMKTIMNNYNNANSGAGVAVTVNSASIHAKAFSIPTQPGVAPGFTVPGEAATTTDCPSDIGWITGTTLNRGISPNGSGAGRNYIKYEATHANTGPDPVGGTETAGQNAGCIDVARSSGGPRTVAQGDLTSFEYYAFAFDAVSWATTSVKAPPFLTTAQLQGIYKCTITDWADVGGQPGPIQRYLPNPASGTRSFFISDVLQLSTYTAADEAAGTNCPAVKGDGIGVSGGTVIEENHGNQIDEADVDKAIFPYSAGQWASQAKDHLNPTKDFRRESRLGGIKTAPASGSPVINNVLFWSVLDSKYTLNTPEANSGNVGGTPVVSEGNVKAESGGSEAAGLFPGVRFVYNVLDNTNTRRGYQAALQLVGFDNIGGGAKSPLCGGGSFQKSAIQSAGFEPLNSTGGVAGGFNNAGATCRKLIVTG